MTFVYVVRARARSACQRRHKFQSLDACAMRYVYMLGVEQLLFSMYVFLMEFI